LSTVSAAGELKGTNGKSRAEAVPILLYHRFGAEIADSMTVTTAYFESQLKYFKDQGYTVIPLRELVDYHLGKRPSIPFRSLVITADDGHKSVYMDMFPLLKKYHVPATLFLYPSALSNAPYAMTWGQLKEMKATGLLDLQSHTFWHPNFKKEKRKLQTEEYQNLVESQLKKAKVRLEKEFDARVDMLAWPFGIYDEELMRKAAAAGYVAAFTMERRDVTSSDNLMALPRYLIAGPTEKKARVGKSVGPGVFPRTPDHRTASVGVFKE
jgi:peptidoglycan/xylan/chitin deacetylase (PgdA/CDA1 family)